MVTETRDLRTGTTYWQVVSPGVPAADRLTTDLTVDVLVVGGGVTGAIIAEAISRSRRVAVVDRRGFAMGSTAASTALVEHEIDTPLIHLAQEIGQDNAARAWLRSRAALAALLEKTQALEIACDLRIASSIYLCGNLLGPQDMEREYDARRAIGLDATLLFRAKIGQVFGIEREAALLTPDNMTVDPVRMASGFLEVARRRGATLLAPVDVVAIARASQGLVAATDQGPHISARHIVLATGYELPSFVPRSSHRVISTYAIATGSQPDRLWPGQVLVWEASDPYLYARTTSDGRVLCGGEDEDFDNEEARDALIGRKATAIAEKLQGIFPMLDTTPELAWAGAFGSTETGLPLITEMPALPGCWLAVGFGGNGMTYAQIAAEIITAALEDRSDPDGDLYRMP